MGFDSMTPSSYNYILYPSEYNNFPLEDNNLLPPAAFYKKKNHSSV